MRAIFGAWAIGTICVLGSACASSTEADVGVNRAASGGGRHPRACLSSGNHCECRPIPPPSFDSAKIARYSANFAATAAALNYSIAHLGATFEKLVGTACETGRPAVWLTYDDVVSEMIDPDRPSEDDEAEACESLEGRHDVLTDIGKAYDYEMTRLSRPARHPTFDDETRQQEDTRDAFYSEVDASPEYRAICDTLEKHGNPACRKAAAGEFCVNWDKKSVECKILDREER